MYSLIVYIYIYILQAISVPINSILFMKSYSNHTSCTHMLPIALAAYVINKEKPYSNYIINL